ncbi:glycerophosphodiester phosphodiesterase family protein [Chondrinema litorale]|uniref:glycerophosphodiester phosphodiesterase family protein n=1 Tax=Chondrinema litorale TaxID=2994555 RepID=UPI002543F77A|nr:glycerophosphodiester phosphodiesterase family protein [Chondrinema litorale]UZR94475.1 glycerophosphodiester phosphodiesterase family protein [Chondrinema litorale]
MINKFTLSLLVTLLSVFSCCAQQLDALIDEDKTITEFFKWTPEKEPLYSAHRGGPLVGYPENCLETFAHTVNLIPCILEIDISLTKDSVLVLMHDNSVDRTTTGTGKVGELTYAEIQNLSLVDNNGNKTNYKVPLLKDVLKWSKDKAILSLDVKRTVPFNKVIETVIEQDVTDNIMIIVYNIEDAKLVYSLAPELMMSVNIRNSFELEQFENTGIPFSNILAFTGTKESPKSIYKAIHDKGTYCIIGTMGNLDNKALAKGISVYHDLFKKGIDIISGDLPELATEAINTYKK